MADTKESIGEKIAEAAFIAYIIAVSGGITFLFGAAALFFYGHYMPGTYTTMNSIWFIIAALFLFFTLCAGTGTLFMAGMVFLRITGFFQSKFMKNRQEYADENNCVYLGMSGNNGVCEETSDTE